jgi:hypothetical protein
MLTRLWDTWWLLQLRGRWSILGGILFRDLLDGVEKWCRIII